MEFVTKLFNFKKLVRAHGWPFLAPFEWSDENERLVRSLKISNGENVTVSITAKKLPNSCRIRVHSDCALKGEDRIVVKKQVSRMLRLDEDFSEFHAICKNDPILRFVAKEHCGGILRSPTAFEDLIKTVCTTNCDWRNTKKMCEALCRLDGDNFPTPEKLLRYSPQTLAKRVPVGYRAKTIHTIAKLTAKGKLPLDELTANGDFSQIKRLLTQIKGVGPYSVNHMLVLLGWYGDIPVDSEVLNYLRLTHFNGKLVSAKKAIEPYERYGKYKFLTYKFGRMARKLNYIDK